MSEGDWLIIMEETQAAVRRFARAEVRSLARQAKDRLQRLGPSGRYPDQKFESFWNEYQFEVQNGLYDPLGRTWSEILTETVRDLAGALSHETAVLLTIEAAGPLPENIGSEVIGSVWKPGIALLIIEELAELAANRGAKPILQ
jgi:hypothetical protein